MALAAVGILAFLNYEPLVQCRLCLPSLVLVVPGACLARGSHRLNNGCYSLELPSLTNNC